MVEQARAAGLVPSRLDAQLVREVCFAAMNVDLRERWSMTDAAVTLIGLLGLA